MAMSREQMLKSKRESMARRRAADPDKARRYQREFHYRNHEHSKATMRAYYARRFFWGRAMKLRGEGRASARELAWLWKSQRGRCALTGRRLTKENAHLDHIEPLARGRCDHPSNLRWLCHEANLAKRALTDAQFVVLCGDVMAWIGRRIQMVDELAARIA